MAREDARRLRVLTADPHQNPVTDRAEQQREAEAREPKADAEEQRVCDGIKRRWRGKGGALTMRVPVYDEGALRAARLDGMRRAREELARVAIVFDGPPSHKSGRFVEAELDGKSANIGEWEQRGKYWELRPTRVIDRLIAEAEKGEG